MPLLSSTTFQPPLPPILLLLPPSSPFQWLLRLALLLLTLLTFPLILILVPISLILLSAPIPALAALAPLPIHPDNRPGPHRSWGAALLRGWWVYTTSGVVWSITSLGAPPVASEQRSRGMAALAKRVLQGFGRAAERWAGAGGDAGGGGGGTQPGELDVREVRIEPVGAKWRRGVLNVDEDGEDEQAQAGQGRILGFWLRNTSLMGSSAPLAPTSKESSPSVRPSTPTLVSAESSIPSATTTTDRKVYLFLAGGGYVTGWPLVHPFLFSLARIFPPEQLDTNEPSPLLTTSLPHRAIFSPDVRRSLSRAHAFPIPLLDAVAAYLHLLSVGYAPHEIVVMGDSAGGGLAWSLVAYLAVLHAESESSEVASTRADIDTLGGPETRSVASGAHAQRMDLGLPGGLILISPWLALPPTLPSAHPYPDFLDTPQLLNAARCYLARFPVVPGRPDPFSSDMSLWTGAFWRRVEKTGGFARAALAGPRALGEWRSRRARSGRARPRAGLMDDVARHSLGVGEGNAFDGKLSLANEAEAATATATATDKDKDVAGLDLNLGRWLETTLFETLSSHHPLVSPSSCLVSDDHAGSTTAATSSSSPASASASAFVSHICRILSRNHTRMLVSAGTAEWFFPPAMALVRAAQDAGVEVETHREMGGFHVEGCLVPAEIPGPGRRLVQALNGWV